VNVFFRRFHLTRPKNGRGRPHSPQRNRWLLWLGIGLFLFPGLQVMTVRFWNPGLTAVMIQRQVQFPDWPREHQWVALEDLPEDILWFSLLSEDSRFFDHGGVDWREVRNVLDETRSGGEPPRGASTITMQTARTLFLWQGRSHLRKALELVYTIWMERFLSKERILELYLNSLETGPGVYGVEAGAHYHFNRSIRDCSREQIALMVALYPNPLAWSAAAPTQTVRARQRLILQRSTAWKKPDQLASFFNRPNP